MASVQNIMPVLQTHCNTLTNVNYILLHVYVSIKHFKTEYAPTMYTVCEKKESPFTSALFLLTHNNEQAL